MLKKTIQFKDLDGNDVVEDFYFNLSKAEVIEMELSYKGGWVGHLERMSEGTPDGALIMSTFKDLIMKTVGRRSVDNRSFEKEDGAVARRFFESDAYSEFLMELCYDAKAGAAFVNGIMPTDMAARLAAGQSPATPEEIRAHAPLASVPTAPVETSPEETPEQKYDRLLSDPTWVATSADFAKMTPRQQQLAFARKS